MKIKHVKRKGLLTIEVIVAFGLMLTFIGVIAALGGSYGKLNRQLWLRHTCILAGQAQLDSLASRGCPIDDDQFHRLWPQVTCSIEKTDGPGDWEGFEKVEVSLSAASKIKTVEVRLIRYLPKDGEVQP